MFRASLTIRAGAAAAVIGASFVGYAQETQPAKQTTEKFGRVLFETSCTPQAQREFERALAMLHSFFFPETIKAFTRVAEIDPSCGIAYWGIAFSQPPNPITGPWDAVILKRGTEAIQKGEMVRSKTERERDWLATIGEFYKDHDRLDHDTRTKKYEKAMEALMLKYPDDMEAKIFYALALNQSIDYHDKTFANQLKAAKILEPIDAKYPDHPGVTHYLIHSYDFAPIARHGVAAADKYDKIAPSAPHATTTIALALATIEHPKLHRNGAHAGG